SGDTAVIQSAIAHWESLTCLTFPPYNAATGHTARINFIKGDGSLSLRECALFIIQAGFCTHTCTYSNDGVCDDGGYGSRNSVCSYGTDCVDCGLRLSTTVLCNNTCKYPNDGICDDGGDIHYSICDYGTDCADCGMRSNILELCTDTCVYPHNGYCDDGGEGSHYSHCDYGTDCADCGIRPSTSKS
uniref:Delta-like protein 4-like n=1 Tax=Saccoglossus kowalevskii TaxID=10224 RepID=A0ABM0MH92_SACKO